MALLFSSFLVLADIEDEIRDFMKKEDDRFFKNASSLLKELEDLYTEYNRDCKYDRIL